MRRCPVHVPAPVTVFRWVQRFTPLLIDAARPCRHVPGDRWFVDDTYVKVAGRWIYLYRVIDQFGQVIDVLVSVAGLACIPSMQHCPVTSLTCPTPLSSWSTPFEPPLPGLFAM